MSGIPERNVAEWARARIAKLAAPTTWGLEAFITSARKPGTLFVRTYPSGEGSRRVATFAWRPDNPLLPSALVRSSRFLVRVAENDSLDLVGSVGQLRLVINVPAWPLGSPPNAVFTDPGQPRLELELPVP